MGQEEEYPKKGRIVDEVDRLAESALAGLLSLSGEGLAVTAE